MGFINRLLIVGMLIISMMPLYAEGQQTNGSDADESIMGQAFRFSSSTGSVQTSNYSSPLCTRSNLPPRD